MKTLHIDTISLMNKTTTVFLPQSLVIAFHNSRSGHSVETPDPPFEGMVILVHFFPSLKGDFAY